MTRYLAKVLIADYYTFAIEADSEEEAQAVAEAFSVDDGPFADAYKEEMDVELTQLHEISDDDEPLGVIIINADDVFV